jgi:hypothetical protein
MSDEALRAVPKTRYDRRELDSADREALEKWRTVRSGGRRLTAGALLEDGGSARRRGPGGRLAATPWEERLAALRASGVVLNGGDDAQDAATLADGHTAPAGSRPWHALLRDNRRTVPPVSDVQREIDRSRPDWAVQKDALARKFPEGWRPLKRLSPDAMDGIRALNRQFPDVYTTPVLAGKFEVSPEAIRRILASNWKPNAEDEVKRQERWIRRGESVWSRYAALGIKPPRRWREGAAAADAAADPYDDPDADAAVFECRGSRRPGARWDAAQQQEEEDDDEDVDIMERMHGTIL